MRHINRLANVGYRSRTLVQTKGPRNASIKPNQLVHIYDAFATIGIPQSSIIEAVKAIVLTHDWSRNYQEPDDDEMLDDIELY